MTAITPKEWKAGKADEAWKVMICARDAMRADELMAWLSSILTNEVKTENGLAIVSKMSGEQIVAGLKAYKESSTKSVENALK